MYVAKVVQVRAKCLSSVLVYVWQTPLHLVFVWRVTCQHLNLEELA